ncbi:alpha/beta fold hydrolase [Pseudorhodoferax sp.]|uniref:alpha/beta fold hydrolase n=1 Tax=Pseudorhodoferax sp. TaxID=1993553 RepID=UPI002DD65946|nr:alpha/beta hydrolase [Pseudorhodoferax sp.]
MKTQSTERRAVRGHHGDLSVVLQGDPRAEVVVLSHSILSSSAMWEAQAALLAQQGWRVLCIDTTGHGDSPAPAGPVSMDGLATDTVAVLDALGIARAHYVGLSLGGMSGFGLGIRHAERVLSLVLCDARADAPPAVAAPWDERIALAQQHGSCAPLAAPTIERWFGKDFVAAQPAICQRLQSVAASTSVGGFVACARAIQGLDYVAAARAIRVPVTLVVGANDGVLPAAMQDLHERIAGSVLETVPDAGHLPNIDQPDRFNASLLGHFARLGL